MKQKLIALFLIIVMVASTLTAIAATTATPVSAATATQTTLSVGYSTPAVNTYDKFTVTLKAGTTVLSKPVKIWHTTNGVRYEDGTHNTVNGVYSFVQKFGSKGQRVYHAEFAATGTYGASSGTVTVNVQPIPTTTTITASTTTPTVGQAVTITVTLKTGTILLSAPIKIWHTTPDGKRWEDGTHNTVNGVYKFNQAFASGGQRIYHAEYAGNNQYGASAGTVTVNVRIPTTTTITASNANPLVNHLDVYTITLKAGSASLSKPVKIWHSFNGVRYEDGTHNTVNGVLKFAQAYFSEGQSVYHAEFAGDSQYGASAGTVTVNVQKIPTTLTITASNTNPKVGEPVTITITLKGTGRPSQQVLWDTWHGGGFARYEYVNVNNYGVYQTTITYPTSGTYYERAFFYGDSQYAYSMGEVIVNVQPT